MKIVFFKFFVFFVTPSTSKAFLVTLNSKTTKLTIFSPCFSHFILCIDYVTDFQIQIQALVVVVSMKPTSTTAQMNTSTTSYRIPPEATKEFTTDRIIMVSTEYRTSSKAVSTTHTKATDIQ